MAINEINTVQVISMPIRSLDVSISMKFNVCNTTWIIYTLTVFPGLVNYQLNDSLYSKWKCLLLRLIVLQTCEHGLYAVCTWIGSNNVDRILEEMR